MLDQEIQHLKIEDLVLWTENPRDPFDIHATAQDIVDRALADDLNKWTLRRLANEMGEHYDFSELPTVVFHGKKPIVYDGNRRVILGKIKLGFVEISPDVKLNIPNFPEKIPCNVCKEKIALDNVYRKHADNGSWLPLERDIFLQKHMGQSKSDFVLLEEATGIIRANPHLNQGFVKDEVFTKDNLEKMGFFLSKGKLRSVHDDTQGTEILKDLSEQILAKEITTRKKRGQPLEVLSKPSLALIRKNKNNEQKDSHIKFKELSENENQNLRHSRRTKSEPEIFGGKLSLRAGEANNIYRDICDLYKFYLNNKASLSASFPSLIRMALRLLCEAAAKENRKSFDNYLKDEFSAAKQTLGQDAKTTLSNQNVKEGTIIQLLQTGAHNYASSNSLDQTLAISIMLGAILKISHGQNTAN